METLQPSSLQMIRYPRLKALQDDVADCRALSRKHREPHCMALEGRSGAGKTWLIRDYLAHYPRIHRPDGQHIPVLYAETPYPATIKATAQAILEALGDPLADKGTTPVLNSRLVHFIQACGVELVILDDFHHLIDTDSQRVIRKTAQWLKALVKTCRVPFLVVGITGEVRKVLRSSSELSRLFAVQEELTPFGWNDLDEASCLEFVTFVYLTERAVSVQLSEELVRTEWLRRLHYASDGVVSYVMKLFNGVSLHLPDVERSVSLAAFAREFDKRISKDLIGKTNPFLADPAAPFVAPARTNRDGKAQLVLSASASPSVLR